MILYALYFAMGCFGLGLLLNLWRIYRGPGQADRVLALDVGLVILGGLTTSTFLTVMVIPTIYSLVDDLTGFLRRIVAAV